MRLDFQKTIASSQATLPVVGSIALLLWVLMPNRQSALSFLEADYGLWSHLPSFLFKGYWSVGLSAFFAALAVYLMVELNNSNVLLRVSSRMLGSMFAILLAFAIVCHGLQPGSVVMLLSLLSFFPLFAIYQLPHPLFTFVSYLFISVASLVFPKMLCLIPVYWFMQSYLRAFSFRCFVASLLAVVLPYWFYGGVALLTGTLPDFLAHIEALTHYEWGNYTQLPMKDLLTFGFIVLLFLSGSIDFHHNRFLDKTRIRILYNAVIMHGVSVILFISLQPQYFVTLLPLLLIDTAITFGHFFTLTHTRFSHIYNLILLILALAIMALSFMPSSWIHSISFS